jgi:hypothetical protein
MATFSGALRSSHDIYDAPLTFLAALQAFPAWAAHDSIGRRTAVCEGIETGDR